uniref:Uncharacterized protein n=1 Tax=Knipowitschia caucasica TaxID=637954 RepID=A0AAV2LII9_KNICA
MRSHELLPVSSSNKRRDMRLALHAASTGADEDYAAAAADDDDDDDDHLHLTALRVYRSVINVNVTGVRHSVTTAAHASAERLRQRRTVYSLEQEQELCPHGSLLGYIPPPCKKRKWLKKYKPKLRTTARRLLTPDSQTRTKLGTAGPTISTSTDVRRLWRLKGRTLPRATGTRGSTRRSALDPGCRNGRSRRRKGTFQGRSRTPSFPTSLFIPHKSVEIYSTE